MRSDAKCPKCNRVTATHAAGCSVIDCPNRHPEVWCPADGLQGLAGSLAEDRIIRRRSERDSAAPVRIEDL